jgi:hypothetical protein
MKEMSRFYRGYRAVTNLGQVTMLFTSVKAMPKYEKREGSNDFDQFVERSFCLMREVHAVDDAKLATLVGSEESVPERVVMDLIQINQVLPAEVLSYIVKRILQALYLVNQGNAEELELVLHYLRKNRYQEALNEIKEPLAAYELVHQPHRLPQEHLDAALQIATLAYQGKVRKAWQRLFEFPAQHVAMREELAKLLTHKSEGFLRLVKERTLDSWNIGTPQFEETLDRAVEEARCDLIEIPNKNKAMLESLMLRIIGAALYAKDDYDRASAHTLLQGILKTNLEFKPELNPLICKCLLAKIRNSSQVEARRLVFCKREWELLLAPDGPLQPLFTAETLLPEHDDLRQIVYKLIMQHGKKDLVDKMRARFVSHDAYHGWLNGIQLLLQEEGKPVADELVEEISLKE